MKCPFCQQPMRPGQLRSRGYATVWAPDESRPARVPPPFDTVTRGRRDEAVVVGSRSRPAHRCPTCEALLVPPL